MPGIDPSILPGYHDLDIINNLGMPLFLFAAGMSIGLQGIMPSIAGDPEAIDTFETNTDLEPIVREGADHLASLSNGTQLIRLYGRLLVAGYFDGTKIIRSAADVPVEHNLGATHVVRPTGTVPLSKIAEVNGILAEATALGNAELMNWCHELIQKMSLRGPVIDLELWSKAGYDLPPNTDITRMRQLHEDIQQASEAKKWAIAESIMKRARTGYRPTWNCANAPGAYMPGTGILFRLHLTSQVAFDKLYDKTLANLGVIKVVLERGMSIEAPAIRDCITETRFLWKDLMETLLAIENFRRISRAS